MMSVSAADRAVGGFDHSLDRETIKTQWMEKDHGIVFLDKSVFAVTLEIL